MQIQQACKTKGAAFNDDDLLLLHHNRLRHSLPWQEDSLAPLTMAQHAQQRGLLVQQLAITAQERLAQQKARFQPRTMFKGALVGHVPSNQLPALVQASRPLSADAVKRTAMHSVPSIYRSIDSADVLQAFRSPEPRHPDLSAATQHRQAHAAQLLSTQLMRVHAPAAVITGEDAVQYFFDHDQHQGKLGMFIHCNFMGTDPSEYRPYDLLVVDPHQIDAEHFIVSASGVCHFKPDEEGNSVTPLHQWVREAQHFKALKQMTFFRKFVMVCMFVRWKQQHRREKFQRRVDFLAASLPMVNEWFSGPVRFVANVVRHKSAFA